MPATNLFDELKTALNNFKKFLDDNFDVIKPAIQALKSIVPQITELITKLIDLLNKLKTEIDNLNPSQVGAGLAKVTEFTAATKTLLEKAKDLLPNEAGTINDVLAVVNVVGSLPSLDAVKAEIIDVINKIVEKLNQLK